VNPSFGAVNAASSSRTLTLKYSRTSLLKKHVLRMAQALSWSGPDGRNCILHAALSGQTQVLDFALQVMSEAKHILQVIGSSAADMRVEALRDTLTSDEKDATILAVVQTEDDAALIPEAELSADLDAAAASNNISSSRNASPQGAQVTQDRTLSIVGRSTIQAHSLYQISPLTTVTAVGQHTGVEGLKHDDPEEETRSDDSSDDGLPETPPPPVVEVERVWSRRTSARYQQLTSEKLQKDLIEKERAAAEETARITVCLFPDILDVTAPCVAWCENDANCSTALAKSGNTRCLCHLLDSSFDPSTVSAGGITLAMTAAREGHYDVLDLLMERELDLRGRDNGDKNVLHYAAICTKRDVVSYLLTHPKSKQCKNAFMAS
jgi:hypothetical protein